MEELQGRVEGFLARPVQKQCDEYMSTGPSDMDRWRFLLKPILVTSFPYEESWLHDEDE
jgi:hypothetical protein